MIELLLILFSIFCFGLGLFLGWQTANLKHARFMVQGWDRFKDRILDHTFITVEDVGESWTVTQWKETKWWSPWENQKDH